MLSAGQEIILSKVNAPERRDKLYWAFRNFAGPGLSGLRKILELAAEQPGPDDGVDSRAAYFHLPQSLGDSAQWRISRVIAHLAEPLVRFASLQANPHRHRERYRQQVMVIGAGVASRSLRLSKRLSKAAQGNGVHAV